jgi:predicted AlkP superfamily phosphohydrolase/phosphomutase
MCSALLFSSLILLSLKFLAPTLVDGLLPATMLFMIPTILLYYVMRLSLLIVGREPGPKTGIYSGTVVTVLLIILTGFDLRVLFLFFPGVLSYFLFNRKLMSLALVAAVLTSIVIMSPKRMGPDENPRVFVIGFDAMTPSIVDSLINRGDLPNMKRLIGEGSWGLLQSERQLISPILWTIIGSGYSRDRIGIRGFFHQSTQVKVPRLWDMFEQEGWSVGVYRWLVTWPPHPVNGFLVPGILSRDNRSDPSGYGDVNLIRDIVKSGKSHSFLDLTELGWKICCDGIRGSTVLSMAREVLELNISLRDDRIFYRFGRRLELEILTDIFLNLVHEFHPRFAAFYDNGIDVMGHRMWKFHDPVGFDVSAEEIEKYGTFVCDMYRYSDMAIGRILDEFSHDINVVIVSDHGMEKSDLTDRYSYWVNTDRLIRDLALEDRIYSHSLNKNQFVYPVRQEDAGDFPEFLEERLAGLVFENGVQLFTVGKSESMDHYLINNYRAGEGSRLTLNGESVEINDYLREVFNLSGKHSLYGTVVFNGENIKQGYRCEGATIHDITPTILHWSGLPAGKDMEGRVLLDIFEDAGEIQYITNYDQPEHIDSPDAMVDDLIKERLRALGYLK